MIGLYLRTYIKLFLLLSLCFAAGNNLFSQKIQGFVFIDENKNSLMDIGEKGLEGVLVTNQKDVVVTDASGYFQLKLIEGDFIIATKPEYYQFKLDNYNNPKFYYHYKTKETKEELKFPQAELVEKTPEILYFPVYKNLGQNHYSCLLLGDLQMKTDKQLEFYKEGILPHLATQVADFYVVLGDIAHNNLDILPKEKEMNSMLGIPGYRVLGNHDMNFRASDNKNSKETFRKVYGPDYYSFDYGDVHYVVLNNVIYKGWWKEVRAPGSYSGGLTNQQLTWLRNDLLNVSADKTIVLLSHIPLTENSISEESMKGLNKALENHQKIFAVSGHLHSITAYNCTEKKENKKNFDFEGLVVGATSGSWWSGPPDINDVPVSTCTDGSPKGFFRLNVTNADYNYEFFPVNYPNDFQLKIYIINNEIWVNWFVGKTSDNVWLTIDNSDKKIYLENFIGKDPYMEARIEARKYIDGHVKGIAKTTHLWKVEIPDDLTPDYHSVKVTAQDSRGKLFKGFKAFYLEK